MTKSLSLFAIVGLLITVNQSVVAQIAKTVAGKQVYIELGGPGVVMSANYDARFISNSRLGLGYRLGVGYGSEKFTDNLLSFIKNVNNISSFISEYDFTRTFYTVPVGLNYVFGKPNKASAFELCAGVTLLSRKVSLYIWDLKRPGHVIGHLAFMYRFVPVDGGFSFRVGFTPIIGTAGDLYPMAAISFGYVF